MRYRFLLIIVLLFPLSIFAQENNDSIVRIDTSSVLVERKLNEDISKKYNGQEFNYTTKTGESQNLLARFLNWIGQGLQRIFGIELSPQVLQVLEYLIYILMFLLAIYLLVKVFINESFSSIFTKKSKNFNSVELNEEHIEKIDLNKLLSEALSNKDYRLAIRYQFLLTLQMLSKKDIIEWHFEKTNIDYLTEIKEAKVQLGFKKVAYLYDHIWYGEQLIDLTKYEKFVFDFESVNNLIRQ